MNDTAPKRACAGAPGQQRRKLSLERAQPHVEHLTCEFGVAMHEIAQSLGQRQYPLPHRHLGEDMVDQMRCGLRPMASRA